MSDGYSSDVTITNTSTSVSAYSDMIEVGRITESETESISKDDDDRVEFVMAVDDVGGATTTEGSDLRHRKVNESE